MCLNVKLRSCFSRLKDHEDDEFNVSPDRSR